MTLAAGIHASNLRCKATDFDEQIVAQRAADAAVAHLDELFLFAREIGAAVADGRGVDEHLRHIVDDHRNAQAFAIRQHMIQQRRLYTYANGERTLFMPRRKRKQREFAASPCRCQENPTVMSQAIDRISPT